MKYKVTFTSPFMPPHLVSSWSREYDDRDAAIDAATAHAAEGTRRTATVRDERGEVIYERNPR